MSAFIVAFSFSGGSECLRSGDRSGRRQGRDGGTFIGDSLRTIGYDLLMSIDLQRFELYHRNCLQNMPHKGLSLTGVDHSPTISSLTYHELFTLHTRYLSSSDQIHTSNSLYEFYLPFYFFL